MRLLENTNIMNDEATGAMYITCINYQNTYVCLVIVIIKRFVQQQITIQQQDIFKT